MDWVWIIFLFAFGSAVGSFLNVVIYRVPRGESIVFPGSHCPNCGRAIGWYDNIPIVSWLALRGRCRWCAQPISPRYLVVEASAGVRVVGLYVAYYMLGMRSGAGTFDSSWPMFLSHAALLLGLLACSVVDIELWIVLLEVCWVVSGVGIVAATLSPHAFMGLGSVPPTAGAMGLAAAVGLGISIVLVRVGWLRRSFAHAGDKPLTKEVPHAPHSDKPDKHGKAKKAKKSKDGSSKPAQIPQPAAKTSSRGEVLRRVLWPVRALIAVISGIAFGYVLTAQSPVTAVAMTQENGVSPRREMFWEILFLAPSLVLAGAAYLLVTKVPSAGNAWFWLTDVAHGSSLAPHVNGLLGAVFGYLIGGLWVWGMRIGGTLAFGKEAMGLGDVHLMAAVGAVTGWVVPSIAFFVAPVFALLWALYLGIRRGQRELPYGPWLALATMAVMVFYDRFVEFLSGYGRVLEQLNR